MTPRPARRGTARPSPPSFALHGDPQASARERRVLAILSYALAGALAVALLVMILGPHRVGDYMAETDFYGAYAEGARAIQQGRLDPSRYGVIGPGYEIALGLLGFVVRDLFLAAELLSWAATLVTLLLWVHLVRDRAGPRAAFFVALFLATNAYFFRHGYGALTDAPAIALQAAALFLLLTRSGGRAFLAAGAVAALAFLTRYNAVVLLPLGVAAALLGGTRAERRGRAALLYAAGFLLPVVPWVLYSATHGGSFELQLHHNIAYDVFARARGIPWDEYQRTLQPQFRSLADVIARDPAAVGARLLHNVVDHLRQDAASLLTWPLAAAAAAGVVLGALDGSLRRLWPAVLHAALLFLTLVPVFYSERYSLALLPVYATLAALAFASPRFALVWRRRLWLKPALAALPVAAALLATQRVQARVLDQLPVEVLECAAELRERRVPGDRIIARKWHIAYHGGVEGVGFPFTRTLGELAAYAREARARWLYISWPEVETRPEYGYLLDTSAVVPGLTARCVTRPHPAVLYEIGPEFGREPAWLANDTLKVWHSTYAQVLIEGPTPPLLFKLGRIAWLLGRYDRAREALALAAERDPGNVEVLLLLGNVMIVTRDAAGARQVFRRVEGLQPGNVLARLGLGWASLVEGDLRGAGDTWRPVIGATQNANTLMRMVQVYRALGDREAEDRALATLGRVQGGG